MNNILRKGMVAVFVTSVAWFAGSAQAADRDEASIAAVGSLRGVTRNSQRQAIPNVTVFVHNVEGNQDRIVTSGASGNFAVENLRAGHYQLIAAGERREHLPVTLVEVAAGQGAQVGCEFGGGVSCFGNTAGGPKQSFIGYMIYNRMWFHKDLYGLTLGGGQINNPGRYLVLIPPINGMTAASAAINSPYFTANPGDSFKAWDSSITFDYMPKQWLTFRWEYDYRHANVPYWSGRGGVTPPPGTNNGFPTQFACMDGSPSPTAAGCAPGSGGLWSPDLRRNEQLIDIDLMVKF